MRGGHRPDSQWRQLHPPGPERQAGRASGHNPADAGPAREVIRLRRRYIVELERTADDHIEGVVGRDGLSEALPFHGWIALLSPLERPPSPELEPAPDGPP